MTPLPKRRTSSRRRDHRRLHEANQLSVANLSKCSACGAPQHNHMACSVCGNYKGRKYTIA